MTTTRYRLFAVLLLFAIVPSVHAQLPSGLSIGGQLRHRSELDARDFNADTTPADVHLLRTRLHAAVRPADRATVFVQLQDSRRFGDGDPDRARGTLDPSVGQLDLHQAYFQIDSLFQVPLSLRVGRQELIYGNQRLVGSVGWSNVGRTFDAARLAYESDRGSIHLFAARLVSTPVEDQGSQNFVGLYSTWQLAEGHVLDAFALLDNDTNDVPGLDGESVDRLVRVTPGVALRGTAARFSYAFEAAYQTGERAVAVGEERSSIGASLLSASGRYVLAPPHHFALGAGYTRLSGDNAPGDGDLGQFNTLFATNHKFYGFMDFFPSTAAPFGLQDAYVHSSARVSEQVQIVAAVHHFAQSEAAPGSSAQTLGQELDLTLTYRFADAVTVSAGLSGFVPDDAMEQATGNDEVAYWGYLMSTINF
jgi:hypothetical protein